MPAPQVDGHQQMALSIHKIFSQDGGIPISSLVSEQVSEMKLWLGAIANGQLRIVDTAQTVPPKGLEEKDPDGTPPNKD